MLLVDTSVWIEYLKAKQPFHSRLAAKLAENSVITSGIVFGELFQGAKTKRENELLEQLYENLPDFTEQEMFLQAGRYSQEERLYAKGVGLIDSFLIVYARSQNAQIWSLDKKLKSVLAETEIFE